MSGRDILYNIAIDFTNELYLLSLQDRKYIKLKDSINDIKCRVGFEYDIKRLRAESFILRAAINKFYKDKPQKRQEYEKKFEELLHLL